MDRSIRSELWSWSRSFTNRSFCWAENTNKHSHITTVLSMSRVSSRVSGNQCQISWEQKKGVWIHGTVQIVIFFWLLDLLLNCNYFWSLWNTRIVRKNTPFSLWSRGRTETSLTFHLQFTPNLYLGENTNSEMNKLQAEKGLIQSNDTALWSYLDKWQVLQASCDIISWGQVSPLNSDLALWTPPQSINKFSIWCEPWAFPNTFPACSTPPQVIYKIF